MLSTNFETSIDEPEPFSLLMFWLTRFKWWQYCFDAKSACPRVGIDWYKTIINFMIYFCCLALQVFNLLFVLAISFFISESKTSNHCVEKSSSKNQLKNELSFNELVFSLGRCSWTYPRSLNMTCYSLPCQIIQHHLILHKSTGKNPQILKHFNVQKTFGSLCQCYHWCYIKIMENFLTFWSILMLKPEETYAVPSISAVGDGFCCPCGPGCEEENKWKFVVLNCAIKLFTCLLSWLGTAMLDSCC